MENLEIQELLLAHKFVLEAEEVRQIQEQKKAAKKVRPTPPLLRRP
jgi:hypothetical protein